MSVFDLFRGFFGVSRGHDRGRRDPFFDGMTHDDDEDDEEDGFYYDGFRDQQDSFDGSWSFGFSFGPDGMRFQEPPGFGHVIKEMEEIFSQLGHWDDQREFDVPRIIVPPSQDRAGKGASSGNPLRDFMLKSPDKPALEPPSEIRPSYDSPEFHFHQQTPFSKFNDIWKHGFQKPPDENLKEDRDLDSAVSSGGLDQILKPPAGQAPSYPKTKSFFQSVTVTKVVKPDGTVEERRTVRDGRGNEETTVTRSGMPEGPEQQPRSLPPGDPHLFSDLRDDDSLFSKFFGGFK